MHKPEQDMCECVTDYATGKGAKRGKLATDIKEQIHNELNSTFS